MSSAPDIGAPARTPSPPPFRIVGAPRTPLRDSYHAFLRAPWSLAIARLVGAYFALNLGFALLFFWSGGVANARAHSLRDAFYFSVQTFGTIGYGAMYPASDLANAIVVVESITGLLATALATGLVFAKFGRATARVMFGHRAVIALNDGVPTLMIRLGNERANQIVEAQFFLTMVRTETTREGVRFYRMYDLKLARARLGGLSRSFTVMHLIDESSPLFGYTPERMKSDEIELNVSVIGFDDVTRQTVHAQHNYIDSDVVFGARHRDIIHEEPGGQLVLDLTHFHSVVHGEPTDAFPYPRR
jgi:inward rectifier potassium channel